MKRIKFLQSSLAFLGGGFLLSSFKMKDVQGVFIENSPFLLPSSFDLYEVLKPQKNKEAMAIEMGNYQ